ncbi:MAG TPA: WD40 repeat domain-containing protein [Coleofasciculaceae cyanobacterium]|jgi:WD40 repeat protein
MALSGGTQPLAQGLELKEGNSQEVLKEILAWTRGQPFLTQKLGQSVLSSSKDKVSGALTIPSGTEGFWVESVVKSRIIHKWESQDEPEHLRTIRDHILRNEERSGRLLGIYQQILQGVEVETDDSREQTELALLGLVVKQPLADGTLITILNGHKASVEQIEFSPDGKTLASASNDQTVVLWDLNTVVHPDNILKYGCGWVGHYLRTNAKLEQSDRPLCDDIASGHPAGRSILEKRRL